MTDRRNDAQLVEQIENELRAMAQHVEFAGQEYHQWFYFTNEAEYKTARRILDIVDAHDKRQRKEAGDEVG